MSITCIRWNGQASSFFKLRTGVRQGGVLSPFLFAVFIDSIVNKVKATNVGCYISSMCMSVFMYADDILLLAPTVTGLQLLLNQCEGELLDLDMRVNSKKSVCLRFGARFNTSCASIESSFGGPLQWVDNCRYLGVYFTAGRVFRCSFVHAKSSFFRSVNSILCKVGGFASEEVILSLIKSKCLPCLLYSIEVCPIKVSDKHSLDFTLTRILMKILRTGSSVVIKECQF